MRRFSRNDESLEIGIVYFNAVSEYIRVTKFRNREMKYKPRTLKVLYRKI
jgi:hypothetical protein